MNLEMDTHSNDEVKERTSQSVLSFWKMRDSGRKHRFKRQVIVEYQRCIINSQNEIEVLESDVR